MAPVPSPEDLQFLVALMRRGGKASVQRLGPQLTQAENAARQRCKRRGWAIYTAGCWCITDEGRAKAEAPDAG